MELVVTAQRPMGRTSVETLDDVHKAQFLRAAREAFGEDFQETDRVFDYIAEDTGEEEGDMEADYICQFCVLADAAAPDTPRYEFWVLLVDSGTLFPAGSPEPTGVGMIQFYMEDGRGTPETKALAQAAQKAFDAARRSAHAG